MNLVSDPPFSSKAPGEQEAVVGEQDAWMDRAKAVQDDLRLAKKTVPFKIEFY